MATEKRISSDLPIPPGEYLAEVLAARGITQAELARRTGRPVQAVNEIIKGTKAITPTTALELERTLGVPAHIWTGLESRFQLIKARLEETKRLQGEAAYLALTPYKQLADLERVENTRDSKHKVRELHRFYGVTSLANVPATKAYAASFRCAGAKEASGYALAAWLRCAEIQAGEIAVGTFDRVKLRKSLGDIRALTTKDPAEFDSKLKRLLARCGIALVLLPHFPKTCAQGATFWLKPDQAVLVMSLRGRWADVFWFSFFHEVGHILLHGKKTFVDGGPASPELARQEKEADDFAANSLIEKHRYDKFIEEADFGPAAIEAFAKENAVPFGIVIGRLQHEGLIGFNSPLNRLRARYKWKND